MNNNSIKKNHNISIILLLVIIFFILISFINKPNEMEDKKKIIIDSSPKDTIGMWNDMVLIAKNIKLELKKIKEIYSNLRIVKVNYYSFDNNKNADYNNLHEGILVVNKEIVEDTKNIFKELLKEKFVIYKVIPSNKFPLSKDFNGWDDDIIMENNVTTCFNLRMKTNKTSFSLHGIGKAIDINPLLNPYIEKLEDKSIVVHPKGAIYDTTKIGTIYNPKIVKIFLDKKWIWGGNWKNPIDYQHFEKK